MKLADRIAIVTGGARGIGEAIATRFARDGAKVVVNYARSEKEANAEQSLRAWQSDIKLHDVRDATALAKLSQDEANSWQQLWADVDALLRRVKRP